MSASRGSAGAKPRLSAKPTTTPSTMPARMYQVSRLPILLSFQRGQRDAPIDTRQRSEVVKRHGLVALVHRCVDQAELEHRAQVLEESRVGRAAAGRGFG